MSVEMLTAVVAIMVVVMAIMGYKLYTLSGMSSWALHSRDTAKAVKLNVAALGGHGLDLAEVAAKCNDPRFERQVKQDVKSRLTPDGVTVLHLDPVMATTHLNDVIADKEDEADELRRETEERMQAIEADKSAASTLLTAVSEQAAA